MFFKDINLLIKVNNIDSNVQSKVLKSLKDNTTSMLIGKISTQSLYILIIQK